MFCNLTGVHRSLNSRQEKCTVPRPLLGPLPNGYQRWAGYETPLGRRPASHALHKVDHTQSRPRPHTDICANPEVGPVTMGQSARPYDAISLDDDIMHMVINNYAQPSGFSDIISEFKLGPLSSSAEGQHQEGIRKLNLQTTKACSHAAVALR